MKKICVYCGSSNGVREVYTSAADELADVLVQCDPELVYGGADKGLMGMHRKPSGLLDQFECYR